MRNTDVIIIDKVVVYKYEKHRCDYNWQSTVVYKYEKHRCDYNWQSTIVYKYEKHMWL